MKIKLAILEKDGIYLKRLEAAFNIKYADKLEIFATTDREFALQSLREKRIDVFLADGSFDIETESLPTGCVFAWLVETADIESVRGVAAVCKFQKADTLYRQILGLFSEKMAAVTGVRADAGGKTLAFVSAAGGTGCSAAAAGCAMRFARKGKKTLYLNLERFGSADIFFRGEGGAGLGDVIYAIKSKKGNLAMKLESAVKQDPSGVFFYSATKMALDMAELGVEETRQIISELRASGGYDYIILDLDFSLEKNRLKILEECNSVVFVADGSAVSNGKLERALSSLKVLEQQGGINLLARCCLLYNRFSSRTSCRTKVSELRELGGISRYEGFDTGGLLQQIREQPVFDALE